MAAILTHLEILQQLLPIVRLDGYFIMGDLVGVPDLFRWVKPILTSFLPGHWHDPQVRRLRGWVRWAVTGWVALVVPVLAVNVWVLVTTGPHLLATTTSTLRDSAGQLSLQLHSYAVVPAVVTALSMVALSLPLLGLWVMATRVAGRLRRQLGAVAARGPRQRVAVVLGRDGGGGGRRGHLAARPAAGQRDTGTRALVGPGAVDARGVDPRAGDPAAVDPRRVGTGPDGDQQRAEPGAVAAAPEPAPLTSSDQHCRRGPVARTSSFQGEPCPVVSRGGSCPPPPSPWPSSPAARGAPPPPPRAAAEASTAARSPRPSVAGTHLARSSLDLVFAPGGHWVHATNFAVAHSTCDGCRSVAASIQVVVVRDKGASVDAGNAALALNEGCTSCESLADAHQVVLLVGPRTTLAGWVHQAVQDLRAELADLVASDLPLAELQLRIDALADRLQDTAQSALTEHGSSRASARADLAGPPAAPVP